MSAPGVIPLRDAAFWRDPYPLLNALREAAPTARTDGGVTAILRHADCDALLRGDGFVNEGVSLLERRGFRSGDALLEWRRLTLGALNGPAHRRIRALVGRAITHQSVDYLRPLVRATTEALLAPQLARGEVDVVADLARQLPLAAISDYLGIAAEDRDRVADTVVAGSSRAFGVDVDAAVRDDVNARFAALMDFIRGLIAARRLQPRSDLLSRLLAAEEGGERLSGEEVAVLFLNLFAGAIESTASAMASGMWLFARHPQQAERVRADPALLAPAVEEVLRLLPPNLLLANRIAARELEFCGQRFAAGESVVIPLAAPNRDPRVFAAPDEFDVARAPRRHVTFSTGEHFCLGQALARCLLQEFFGVMLARCTRLAVPAGPPRWRPFAAVNLMESLPLTFEVRR